MLVEGAARTGPSGEGGRGALPAHRRCGAAALPALPAAGSEGERDSDELGPPIHLRAS